MLRLGVAGQTACLRRGQKAGAVSACLQLRGPSYLSDKKKIPADDPLFALAAVDLIELDAPTFHIARYLPSLRYARCSQSHPLSQRAPSLMIHPASLRGPGPWPRSAVRCQRAPCSRQLQRCVRTPWMSEWGCEAPSWVVNST